MALHVDFVLATRIIVVDGIWRTFRAVSRTTQSAHPVCVLFLSRLSADETKLPAANAFHMIACFCQFDLGGAFRTLLVVDASLKPFERINFCFWLFTNVVCATTCDAAGAETTSEVAMIARHAWEEIATGTEELAACLLRAIHPAICCNGILEESLVVSSDEVAWKDFLKSIEVDPVAADFRLIHLVQ